MARPSSLQHVPPALELAAGEAPVQGLTIHGAPAHPQDVLPYPERVNLASRPAAKRRRGSAATNSPPREDGAGGASKGRPTSARTKLAPVTMEELEELMALFSAQASGRAQRADIDDLTQEAGLQFLVKGAPADHRSWQAYVGGMAWRLILDLHIDPLPVMDACEDMDIPDPAPDPSEAVDATETTLHIRALLQQIPTRDLQVLTWRFVDGLPARAIAARLGMTRKAVARRLARAAEKLRRPCRGLQEAVEQGSEKKIQDSEGQNAFPRDLRDETHAPNLPQMPPGSGGLPATLLPYWCPQPVRER